MISHDQSAAYPFVLNGQQFIPSATAHNKVALFVDGDVTFETSPKTTVLGRAGSAVVLQLPADVKVSSLDITVHSKGDTRKLSVPISQ